MEVAKAIDILKNNVKELKQLRTLSYENSDHELWRNRVNVIIIKAFGRESDEYQWFNPPRGRNISANEEKMQKQYLDYLNSDEVGIKKILQKYDILGLPIEKANVAEKAITSNEPLKAFIAHGESLALQKLKNFLEALGVEPLIVEEQASGNRSVGNNIDWYAKQADLAIILATKGDIDGKTGAFIPRGNVLIEIGKSQELFKDRIIYLLQAGTKFPTNVSEKVWERFTTQCMDDAFIKIVKELKNWGYLTIGKIKE